MTQLNYEVPYNADAKTSQDLKDQMALAFDGADRLLRGPHGPIEVQDLRVMARLQREVDRTTPELGLPPGRFIVKPERATKRPRVKYARLRWEGEA